MPHPKLYLAGPDVFLPNAAAMAQEKIALCAAFGLTGLSPFNPNLDLTQPPDILWKTIYEYDLMLMREADAILANLTPFRGASADAGTLVELGWFAGAQKPAFGYSNNPTPFSTRSSQQIQSIPDPLPNLAIEDFHLPDNLMIPGSLTLPMTLPPHPEPFDSLTPFRTCLAAAAGYLRKS